MVDSVNVENQYFRKVLNISISPLSISDCRTAVEVQVDRSPAYMVLPYDLYMLVTGLITARDEVTNSDTVTRDIIWVVTTTNVYICLDTCYHTIDCQLWHGNGQNCMNFE